MKKTYTINLSGKIFHIDDDALDKLQGYINTLKSYYSKEQDGNEIMDDIENRVGELFSQYMKGTYREVVTMEDVDKVIATMGSPEVIIDGEVKTETSARQQPRKLYRDADNRVFGGVAAGIAAYWGISTLLVRICFILLMFYYGIFFLVYVILWAIVPKARTAKQKLEMKGEDVNVSNIERSIRDEYQEMKNGKWSTRVKRCGEGASGVLQIVGQVFSIGMGVVLFAGSIFILLTYLSVLFLPHWIPWGENFQGLTYAITRTDFILAKLALLLLGVIPILLVVFVSIKLLFTFKSNNKVILLSALVLWLVALVTLVVVGILHPLTCIG